MVVGKDWTNSPVTLSASLFYILHLLSALGRPTVPSWALVSMPVQLTGVGAIFDVCLALTCLDLGFADKNQLILEQVLGRLQRAHPPPSHLFPLTCEVLACPG